MTAATLTNVADSRLGPKGRRLVLDCPHGATRAWLGGTGPSPLSPDDVIRCVLARHAEEQPGCRCIRELWQQYFGCPLGEMILVRGAS
jgi:hypothetical protein